MKRLLSALSGVFSFLPSTPTVVVGARDRHMDVINAPATVPDRIEWNLDDPASIEIANEHFRTLKADRFPSRVFFIEDAPGEIGRKLKEPDTAEHMVSMPEIHAG